MKKFILTSLSSLKMSSSNTSHSGVCVCVQKRHWFEESIIKRIPIVFSLIMKELSLVSKTLWRQIKQKRQIYQQIFDPESKKIIGKHVIFIGDRWSKFESCSNDSNDILIYQCNQNPLSIGIINPLELWSNIFHSK